MVRGTVFQFRAALLGGFIGHAALAADALSVPASVAPNPSTVSAAQLNGIPIEAIEPPGAIHQLAPGASVTGLVTLCEKGDRYTQWLIYLQVTSTSAAEPAPKATHPMALYTSLGNKLEFASCPANVSLRTLGPFGEGKPGHRLPQLHDRRAEFAVDQGFLRLGLDQAAAAILRLVQAKSDLFAIGSKPFGPMEVQKSRKSAQVMEFTATEERAICGLVPALLSYLGIVQHTQGLEELLIRIVDRPSIWSVLRQAGVHADLEVQSERIRPAEPSAWGLPAHQATFYFPLALELNRHHALDITLVVTDPKPPLLACGGIVGLIAQKPADKQTCLMLRIVSASAGVNRP